MLAPQSAARDQHMMLTSFIRPVRKLLQQVCQPSCRHRHSANAAVVPRASRDQHSTSAKGAKAAGGRNKRSSNAQLVRQFANDLGIIGGDRRHDSADTCRYNKDTRSSLESRDHAISSMSASLTRMSADLEAMRADTAYIQTVLDARTKEMMRSSLVPDFGSLPLQPFVFSGLHSCLDYFGEQLGKVGVARHEAVTSIVSAVQAVSQFLT